MKLNPAFSVRRHKPLLRRLQTGFVIGCMLATSSPMFARGGDDGGGDDGGGGGHHDGDEVEFIGRVEVLPGAGPVVGSWQVNGVIFFVTSATTIDQENGTIAVGSLVEVHANRQADGSILASKIEDEDQSHEDFGEAEFVGTITALPGTPGQIGVWTVGGRAVNVTSATSFRTEHGEAAVGVTAEIAGTVLSDGSVDALHIKIEDAENEHEVEDRHFTGVIESLPAGGTLGVWKVSGLTVQVTAATWIEAEGSAPAVGTTVRIEGDIQPDASIIATEINLARAAFGDDSAEVKLIGQIEHLPDNKKHVGNWTVDDVVITITPTSAFDVTSGRKSKKAHEGDEVEIHGRRQADGSILVTGGVLEFEGHETGHHFLKYKGVVASVLPGTAGGPGTLILTNGQVLNFDDNTKFDHGSPVIGSTVSIKANAGADGIDDAVKVSVK